MDRVYSAADTAGIESPASTLGTAVIDYSRGSHFKSAWPEQRTAKDFASFCDAIMSDRAKAKGEQYICAAMSDGHRTKASALPRRWIGLDLDGCQPAEFLELLRALRPLSALAYTTATSKPECVRARIIIELSMAADRGCALETSKHVRESLGVGLAWDASCDRAEQALFLPLHDAQHWRFAGNPVTPLPARLPPLVAPAAVISPPHPIACRIAESDLANAASKLRNAVPGGRNNLLAGVAYGMGQYVGAGRLSRDVTTRALLDAVAAWGEPDKSAATIERQLSEGAREPRVFEVPPMDVTAIPRLAVPTHSDASRVLLVRGDTVNPEAVDWLWHGWLAAGKLHLIGGQPGTGKTTIATAFAATITVGGCWPDGTRAERGSVVIWSGEDDPADTLIPRLRKAGADVSRVHIVSGIVEKGVIHAFDPARDVDALRTALADVPDVRLLVIDPIVSAVSGDSHKNSEVRRGLQPLVDFAQASRCALLGVTHFTKGTAGREPIERVTGSLAFGALARLVMVTAKGQPNEDGLAGRFLARAKSNIGPDGGGFAYDLVQGELSGFAGVSASSVDWGAALQGTARELLADAEQQDSEENEQRSAMAWLREILASGPMVVRDVKRQADESGYSWRSVQRAMRQAGVESKRAGFGQPAAWRLAGRATLPIVAPVAPDNLRGATGATAKLPSLVLPRSNEE